MSDGNDNDMALDALLAVAKSEAPELSEELLRKAFAIQKRHQFDRDEQGRASVQDMQSLVDEHVTAELSK